MFSVENVGTDVSGIDTWASFALTASPVMIPTRESVNTTAIDIFSFIEWMVPGIADFLSPASISNAAQQGTFAC